MKCPEIKKLNEQILLSVHAACNRDINRACICFNIHRNTAEVIAALSVDTLKKLSQASTTLVHPANVPNETWSKLETLKDDALAFVPITQIFRA